MLGIIDYGMGNLGSVENACRFLHIPARILSTPAQMDECRQVILPGVGAFGDCMKHLDEHGFVPALRAWAKADRPLLGICLGLQAMFEGSEEAPGVAGLGLIPGQVRRFRLPAEYKVPQIGWNRVRFVRTECPLFSGIPDGTHGYFVHSYYAENGAAGWMAGQTDYGIPYTSAVWRGNVYATQFHPEKSHRWGLQMLLNFYEATGGGS